MKKQLVASILPNIDRAIQINPDGVRELVRRVIAENDQEVRWDLLHKLQSHKRRQLANVRMKAGNQPLANDEIELMIYMLLAQPPQINFEVEYPEKGVELRLNESIPVRTKVMAPEDLPDVLTFLGMSDHWRRDLMKFVGKGTSKETFKDWHERVTRNAQILVAWDEMANVAGIATTIHDGAHRATLALCIAPHFESLGLIEALVEETIYLARPDYSALEIRIPGCWENAMSAFYRLEFRGFQLSDIPNIDGLGMPTPEFLFQVNPRKHVFKCRLASTTKDESSEV